MPPLRESSFPPCPGYPRGSIEQRIWTRPSLTMDLTRVDRLVAQSAICKFFFASVFPWIRDGCDRGSGEMLTDIRIVIHTAKGDIDATLFPSKAPVATANFLNLVSRKFYDGLTFHRVVPRFVIQGGDPIGDRKRRARLPI